MDGHEGSSHQQHEPLRGVFVQVETDVALCLEIES